MSNRSSRQCYSKARNDLPQQLCPHYTILTGTVESTVVAAMQSKPFQFGLGQMLIAVAYLALAIALATSTFGRDERPNPGLLCLSFTSMGAAVGALSGRARKGAFIALCVSIVGCCLLAILFSLWDMATVWVYL